MSEKRLRKRDRALNALKSGTKTVGRGFQKVKPILQKSRYFINPRTAMLGLLFTAISVPSPAMAWEIPDVPGAVGNLTVAAFLAAAVEEGTYHGSAVIPGSEWFNAYIGAPVAVAGVFTCAVGAAICESVGWHNKGWRFMSGSVYCSSYLVGAHRANPTSPTLTAARVISSPFEIAKDKV